MNYEELRPLVPQKFPFIFVDRVLELEAGRRILCLKNVTANESFFSGHFPDFSIMPGVLIIEALAQSSILLFRKSSFWREQLEDPVFLLRATNIQFLNPVFPGDQLSLEIVKEKVIPNGAMVSAAARVEDQVAAKGSLTFGIAQKRALMQGRPARRFPEPVA